VEHPVTEMVTGIDLVEQQLRIAMGLPILFNQNDIQLNGHALECRIYAEDAENNFIPSPGKVHRTQWPSESLARTDTWFNYPLNISSDYDPMVAKLITHGSTRSEAISKAISALESTHLTGLTTNINYLKSILLEADFNQGAINTGYCQSHNTPQVLVPENNILAAAYLVWLMNYIPPGKKTGYWRITNQASAIISNQKLEIKWYPESDVIQFSTSMHPIAEINQVRFTDDAITFIMNNNRFNFGWCLTSEGNIILEYQHKPIFITPGYTIDKSNLFQEKETPQLNDAKIRLQAPIPGKITNILIVEGAKVKKGDRLMTLVAMKMENHLNAQEDGIVESILTKNEQQVKARDLLMTIRPVLVSH
jgi:acetyl/propionyl-CoA carboxylase alpha subunit